MKTIDQLRKGFEGTKTFNEYKDLKYIVFNSYCEFYETDYHDYSDNCSAINGAWFMYQELNK